jgi:hypothetical protein
LNSWTRTLNLDDAHTMLALAEVGISAAQWENSVHKALSAISAARRKELVRILKSGFVEFDSKRRVHSSSFIKVYSKAPASAQINLLALRWALSHPLTLVASTTLVAPALASDTTEISLSAVEELVGKFVQTKSKESLRKTRTVLLGALGGIGVLATKGTGKHRSLRASHGAPHPISFSYLLHLDLEKRQERSMMAREVTESSLPCRLTQCTEEHARWCLDESLTRGLLWHTGDEVGHT